MIEADYVVIGAGSAGCVVAARLSENPSLKVVLVEAGGRDWNPLYRIPLMAGSLLRSRLGNWFYFTEPQAGLDGRRIFWPRGKVLGGSTSINGMVYTRGLAADYDAWANAGLRDWSYERVLPLFKRSERHERGASDFHGGNGPQPVTRPPSANPLYDAFIAAGREAGLPLAEDFNAPAPYGVGRYDFTLADGERWSAARSFLDPARARPNLTIVTGCQIRRILFERGRAFGVETGRRGARSVFRAGREVVLCGGTVNSPALLMQSGVGPADDLRALGIAVVAESGTVGANLQDHILVRVEHACTQPVTLHRTLRPDRLAWALIEAKLMKRGPAASFPLLAGAFLKSDPALDAPDLQAHFCPALSTATIRLPGMARRAPAHARHGFFANLYVMRPHSRGRIRLASADPLAAPRIDPGYLAAAHDRIALRRGVRVLREIFAQDAFRPFRGEELSPGAGRASDDALDAWIRATADTVFHPVGTCRMGADAGSVVDERLRVRGVAGLRVADASIMPSLVSANTAAPAMMIGEKAADMILADAGARAQSGGSP
jgi:choline dehydrogenase